MLDPDFVAASRRRDLLLTLVLVGIGLTPAWLAPSWFSRPWLWAGIAMGIPAVYVSWRYSPWWPTPKAELARILEHLDLGPDQSFCDLGAGDGRMVLWVRAATGASACGIEIAPLPYVVARIRMALQGDAGTSIRFGNLYDVDLSDFDVIYVWGTAYGVGTPRFAARMRTALRPGARIVSYHVPIPGLDPECVDTDGQRPIHVYRIGMSSTAST